jgi:hypothetical protein
MNKKILLSLAAAGLVAACGDDNDAGGYDAGNTGQISLTASAPFGPHAGQTMRAALVRASDDATLDVQNATIAAAGTAFSFTFAPTVDLSAAYKVRYWVDFNSNAACDAPPTDHQWEADVPAGQSAVSVTHSTSFTSVCPTFTFPLTFRADGTFNGPHAGQAFQAALVRGSETTALQVASGTVAAAGTVPALSVTFTPELVIGEPYSVKLWIDFNSSGTCEAPGTDHQWSVSIPTSLGSPETVTYGPHSTTFTDVCSFLP